MDRNTNFCWVSLFDLPVALRKESVDRNIPSGQLPAPEPPVALRKESVDRNVPFDVIRPAIDVSLSARRAWIEIRHM